MGRKTKAGARRFAKRPAKRQRRGMTGLPPALPFNRTVFKGILRIATSEVYNNNACLVKDISWAEIFVGVYANLRNLFAEICLTKINVWVMPAAATEFTGLQCLIICPSNEARVTSGIKWTNLGCYPGSVIRKMYQSVYREWHPTSPFEKGWHSTTSKDPLFKFLYMTHGIKTGNGIDQNFDAETVFDFHVKARGLGGTDALSIAFPSILAPLTNGEADDAADANNPRVDTPTYRGLQLSSMILDDV